MDVFAIALGGLLILAGPRPVTAYGVGTALFVYFGIATDHHRHCRCWWEWAQNPNTAPQVVVVIALAVTSLVWSLMRPTPRPLLRRAACYLAAVSIGTTSISLAAAFAQMGVYPASVFELGRIALWCSAFLVVCLLLEIRFHDPRLPRMRVTR